ncbi:MAG: hypothetical protein JWO13_2584 [Acidobacteriales bacterium]|nr:hypothetical protein [Terriglobales bacterium]
MKIAIVGSGPAGCYLADQLLRLVPGCAIDVIDRLPVPFGLVRYGVAPDHQATKSVSRILDRTLAHKQVNFFGNVEVGRDVTLEQLLSFYDAVALATGAQRDRRLGIPGENLPGVIGSGSFVAWYNGHPDAKIPPIENIKSVVVIGNGNVAIDVARVLAKEPSELAGSDLSHDITQLLAAQPLREIHIVGRRGPADAKFTPHELAELGNLKRAKPFIADPEELEKADATPIVGVLEKFLENGNCQDSNEQRSVSVVFHFYLAPVAFVGYGRLQAVKFRAKDGKEVEIAADLAVTCIGYESLPCCTAKPVDGKFANADGKIDERLYVVGWAKRGPSGVIASSRSDAQLVAKKIAEDVSDGGRRGGEGLREHLQSKNARFLDHTGWKRINDAEVARAGEHRCREKFCSVEEMLEASGKSPS